MSAPRSLAFAGVYLLYWCLVIHLVPLAWGNGPTLALWVGTTALLFVAVGPLRALAVAGGYLALVAATLLLSGAPTAHLRDANTVAMRGLSGDDDPSAGTFAYCKRETRLVFPVEYVYECSRGGCVGHNPARPDTSGALHLSVTHDPLLGRWTVNEPGSTWFERHRRVSTRPGGPEYCSMA
jgi:hypothetical protein